ncbi:MAG: sulfur carrier protein ThiS [Acidobacteriota bacterium]
MTLTLNGSPVALEEGLTVAALLQRLELSRERVAIERNGSILPRVAYEETRLAEGDRLEIVQFVGGG